QQAEATLAAAKAKLAAAQADLDYLLGKPAGKKKWIETPAAGYFSLIDYDNEVRDFFTLHRTLRPTPGRVLGEKVAGPAAERLRKALDRKVTLQFTDASASAVLDHLRRKEALGLHIQAAVKGPAWDEKVSATLTEVPLGAALQLLED